jgi:hypothetical protein
MLPEINATQGACMAKIKTRRKMGWILIAFHWTMILCTVGLWTPVYLAARRRRVTVTHIPDGYNGPISPMQ